MKKSKGPMALSILIVAVGIGWLLTSLEIGPGVNWAWTMGLGVVGILVFVAAGGIDKVSLVLGPWFLTASILSVPHQKHLLRFDVELAILVILLGALLFVAQTSRIPTPSWYSRQPGESSK